MYEAAFTASPGLQLRAFLRFGLDLGLVRLGRVEHLHLGRELGNGQFGIVLDGQPEIGVLVIIELLEGQRLVKFADTPEMVAAVEQRSALIVRDLRKRLLRAAVLAGRDGFVVIDLQCASAHFTF